MTQNIYGPAVGGTTRQEEEKNEATRRVESARIEQKLTTRTKRENDIQ